MSQAQKSTSDQVVIGLTFESDWLREWLESSRPVTERSRAKPMQSWVTFDDEMEIANAPSSGIPSAISKYWVPH